MRCDLSQLLARKITKCIHSSAFKSAFAESPNILYSMYTDGSINKDLSGCGSAVSKVQPPPTKIMMPIGQCSQAGLHKWMPFVIFHARSRKRLQLTLPGWFLSRHWFTLCVTMEVEPRIAKQLLLLLQLLLGKMMEDAKKKCIFQLTIWSQVHGKIAFMASYWVIQQSWFARVNALCNLSHKKSREVAAHFWANFWIGIASHCV